MQGAVAKASSLVRGGSHEGGCGESGGEMAGGCRAGACSAGGVQGEAPLLVPDVLVCSVGTEIFFESAGEADREWAAELDQGWDRQGALDAAAAIPDLKPQASAAHRMRRSAARKPPPRGG